MSTPTPDEQVIEFTLGHLSKADLLALIKRMVRGGSSSTAVPTFCTGSRSGINPEETLKVRWR
jgi:hypothetical protein